MTVMTVINEGNEENGHKREINEVKGKIHREFVVLAIVPSTYRPIRINHASDCSDCEPLDILVHSFKRLFNNQYHHYHQETLALIAFYALTIIFNVPPLICLISRLSVLSCCCRWLT